MRTALQQIIHKYAVFTIFCIVSLNISAEYCTEIEGEIQSIYNKQELMKNGEDEQAPNLKQLKEARDAQMAQLIALRSLKKIRDGYLDFKKESESLQVAQMFDQNTAKALKELETHTQAVTKYAVINSTVMALAKMQAANIAENKDEKNPFKKLFNHLKNGNGQNLYSFMKSTCSGANERVKNECSVFNDFTENFELDEAYEEMAEITINNYGELLKKIYAGSATNEDANRFLEEHLEALKTDAYNISLDQTQDGLPSIRINDSQDSLSLLSENDELKKYYENTLLKLYDEVREHNDDKEIFENRQSHLADIYFNNSISDESFATISTALNKLKQCRGKITKCEESINLEALANAINSANESIGSNTRVTAASINLNDSKDDIKAKFGQIMQKALKDTERANQITGRQDNYSELFSANLNTLCPNSSSTNVETASEKFYKCIEDELNDSKLDEMLATQEKALEDAEKAISDLFITQPMKDLEVIKAMLMRTYKINCKDSVVYETYCTPSLGGGDDDVRSLLKFNEGLENTLLAEDYSRYYYGPQQTNNYQTSDRYLKEFCPQTNKLRCNGEEKRNDDEVREDEFAHACEFLHLRSCSQKEDSFTDSRLELGSNQYFDWDPATETMVKKQHRQSFWPQVAMYAAQNSYAFMGPMIATEQLRAQLPGAIYTGMYNQQQIAYRQQYYDWYMDNLNLSDANLFGFYGGPFYSGSTNGFGNGGINYGYNW